MKKKLNLQAVKYALMIAVIVAILSAENAPIYMQSWFLAAVLVLSIALTVVVFSINWPGNSRKKEGCDESRSTER